MSSDTENTSRRLQHPVPDSLLVQIGDMTVSFALLEDQMQSLLGSLIREHQRVGQIICSLLSFSSLRAAIIGLYKDRHGDDEDYDRLRDLLKRAAAIEQQRNRITHSIWGADGRNSAVRMKITCREKDGWRFTGESYDTVRLKAFADDIKSLASDIQTFYIDLVQKGKLVNNPGEKIW
jgi:hypothetical protein